MRRIEARSRGELAFSFFAPKLGKRFPRSMFDGYLEKYMNDSFSPEDVERRGRDLVQTLQRHVEAIEPPKKVRTLEDLAQWFTEKKEHIQHLPVDDKTKRFHLVELTQRYNELSSKLLEEIEP
jgi:hypothetical protein